MRESEAGKNFQEKLTNLTPILDRIEASGVNGFDDKILNSVKSFVQPLLMAHLEESAAKYIICKWEDIWSTSEVYRAFKHEIAFVILQEASQLDPFYKHNLMTKTVSEMTGYEYRMLLRVIAKEPTIEG